MKQKKDRYEMHKYWGKKPAKDLNTLIEKYTKEGDTVLDPFSGYGVFCCEAYLMNRNVISNDLNPIANFINNQLMERNVDLNKLKKDWKLIKTKFENYNAEWYSWNYKGQEVLLRTILRDKNDFPLKIKFNTKKSKIIKEVAIDKSDAYKYIEYENKRKIYNWYPKDDLIPNSRISSKKGMKIKDLFTKRTLACHSKLLSLIEKYSNGKEKDLLKVAFTANLANCSKLVPPIRSKGDMAPGAWMTGFYIGETYLENNVLHFFENRFKKIIKGKENYLNKFNENHFFKSKHQSNYRILQNDAKNLKIKDNSVDYVFTDPPYGSAVPYFEQSIIWNSWLKFKPNYKSEIVISDSNERDKNNLSYENEIHTAFSEIRRVLKINKYFSLTYHSLSGKEWKAITNACIKNGFVLKDYKWLVQKTFTPRQINRSKSIKGDVLITFEKRSLSKNYTHFNDLELESFFIKNIIKWLNFDALETNEIFLKMMKIIFSKKILIGNIDLFKILNNNFKILENNKWSINE